MFLYKQVHIINDSLNENYSILIVEHKYKCAVKAVTPIWIYGNFDRNAFILFKCTLLTPIKGK